MFIHQVTIKHVKNKYDDLFIFVVAWQQHAYSPNEPGQMMGDVPDYISKYCPYD